MNNIQKLLISAFALIGSSSAFAIDTVGIQAAVTAAETDGLAVGAMVVAAIAAMVVVGVVIAMVRKL